MSRKSQPRVFKDNNNSSSNDKNESAIVAYLKRVYFDPEAPASYSGLDKIWSIINTDPEKPKKLDKKKLRQWLGEQETYQMHKRPPRRVPTEPIILDFYDLQWDIDILVMPFGKPGARKNVYILGCCDLFSRKVWARVLRRKTASETARAFKSILKEGRKCLRLRSDAGGEFVGAEFQELLKSEKIHHIIAYGHIKANYIERWFRTFQMKYYRYAYHKNTSKFQDIVESVVKSYNNTIHGTTKMRPNDVNAGNALELYDRVYTPILLRQAREKLEPTLTVGDLVRISLFKDRFKRGFSAAWSEEVFSIFAIVPSHPIRYKIKDLKDEEIQGSFYIGELKKVNATDSSEINWKIERIISTKRVGGRKKSLVKWFSYPPKFNTVLNTSDIGKYTRWT